MKFRKGNLVEVLRREDDPCGSWFTGNILSADGDYYIVRYKLFTDCEGRRVVETVKGKDVRPLPPYVNRKNCVMDLNPAPMPSTSNNEDPPGKPLGSNRPQREKRTPVVLRGYLVG
ncbi:hypothetical protein V6Z12_D08G076000 [Gossypium hirsutum]